MRMNLFREKYSAMASKEKYIIAVTNELHDSVDSVFEDLMDGEYDKAIDTLEKISSIAIDIKKSFNDEI